MTDSISWPFRISGGQFPATSDETDQIDESIKTILGVRKGELVMADDFGVNVDRYAFENLDPVLIEALKYEVATALGKYEKRIGVRQIIPTQNDSELILTIRYFIKSTRQDRDTQVKISRT